MKRKQWASLVLAAAMAVSVIASPLSALAAARPQPLKEPAAAGLNDGLVLYSSFDDETAADLSGSGNNGTLVGDLQFAEGVRGKALLIEGQNVAASDDKQGDRYVDYGKNIQFGTEDFSISLWYKATGESSNSALISNKNYKSGANTGFAIGRFGNGINLNTAANNTRGELTAGSEELLQSTIDGQWHHVVMSADRDGKLCGYVDGQPTSQKDISALAQYSMDAGYPLVVGASGSYCNGADNGLIDEVRVYKRAVSAEEAAALYEQDKPKADLESGLVLYASFDEGNAADESGNGHDGALTGSPAFADGVRGKAISLDNGSVAGSSSAQAVQYVDFGTGLNSLLGGADFTLSMWVKTSGNGSNNGTILSNKDYASGNNIGLAIGNYNNASDVDVRVNFSAKQGSRIENRGVTANDDQWHQLLTTFDRDGNMVTYLDGEQVKSTSMTSQEGLSVDTKLPLILGADGKKVYGMSGCTVDELRIYDRVLTTADIAALYREEGVSTGIERLRTQLNSVVPSAAFPQEDIDAMAAALDEYQKQIAAQPDNAAALLEQAQEEFAMFLNGKTPTASFHLVSDVHINGTSQRVDNYTKAMQDMATVMADTNIGFVNAGDFTSQSTAAQYESFYETTAAHNPVSDEKTLILLGNHDVRGPNQNNWNKDPNQESPYWQTAKELYLTNNAPYMPADDKETLYYSKELGGYTFIMLNTENGLKDAMYMSDEQLAWFEQTMKECYEEDPTKPVFIISHQPLNNSHWMSNILDGFDGWSNAAGTGPYGQPQPYNTGKDAAVKEVMAKYPVGVFLSGHIHNQLDVAEVQMREYGTLVDLPSFAEPCIGIADIGTGYEVAIYDNEIVFRARNFVTGQWMPQYDKVVKTPTVTALYQQALARQDAGQSSPALDAAVEQAAALLTRQYDQEGLAWNNTATPDTFYFHEDAQQQIEQARAALAEALGQLPTEDKEVESAQDIYLQAGTQIDKPTSEYGDGTAYNEKVLKVKIADDHRGQVGDEPSLNDPNQRYTRKTLISFPLEGLEGYGRFELKLYMTADVDRDFTTASVKVLDAAEWDDATVTWNSAPKAGETAGTISRSNIENGVCTVDVTDAVAAAVAAGQDKIAFQILNDEEANSNLLSFHSSRSDDQTKVPVLAAYVSGEEPGKEEDPAFTALRENYRDYLLGGDGTGLDMTNAGVKAYVENLNETANGYYQDLIKSDVAGRTDLFDDLELCPEADYIGKFSQNPYYTYTSNLGTTARRLRDIAYAWATEGCDLYHNETVLAELISALDHFTDTYYTGKYSGKSGGNWYQWVITVPDALMSTCIVLYDQLSASQLQHYVDVCKWYVPDCMAQGPHSNDPKMTGGNLLLKANSTLQTAILDQNASMLENVKEGVKTVLVYNDASQFYTKDADGFYKDGSYIQHQALAYIGGYGSDLYKNLGVFLLVLDDSQWEIAYEDGREQVAYDTVFNGIEPFLYDVHMMDMVSSRDVSRPGDRDLVRIASIMNSILPLRGTFPTEEENARFDSMAKYYLNLQPQFFFENMSSITAIMTASQILADDSIQPRSTYALTKVFTMDKAVHVNDDFGFAISMHSDRTYGHELINSEGKRTWNTSDGMTYLYDEDTRQYADGYWAAVDPTRLSGITAEHVDLGVGTGDRTKNIYPWTGGATLQDDGIGAIGTHFRTLSKAGSSTRNGTDVKKSWFVFGDKIVALGAGITSTTGNGVESIVDNRKIGLDGENRLAVNGQEVELELNTAVSGEASPNMGTKVKADYITLAGENGSKIGYYFPGSAEVNLLKEQRTGKWSDQGTGSGEATATFATIFFDHGTKPTNESYAYILMPGADDGDMAAYAADPTIEILQNDAGAAAVHDSVSNTTAVNFWNAGGVGGIASDSPASVVLREQDGKLTLAVADPTQQKDQITITLPYLAGTVIESDENVTITSAEPFTVITVDTKGCEGTTSTITFEATPAAGSEVMSVASAQPVLDVTLGTAFKHIPLPETVTVLTADGTEHEVGVQWQRGDYDKNQIARYEITGTLVLEEGLQNSAGITASAVLNVLRPQIPALEDTNVRDGKYADSNATEGGTSLNCTRGTIAVKQDAISYLRYGYIKLDLEGADPNATHYYLNIQSTAVPGSDYKRTDLYAVESDWQGETLTYNTRPDRIGDEPAASLTKEMLQQSTVQSIDITAAVQAALERGDKQLSLELVNVGGGSDSGLYIHSLESTTLGVQKPSLSWDSVTLPELLDTRNAEMLLETVRTMDRTLYANLDEEALDEAAAALQALVDDPDTTNAELNKAESDLSGILLDLRYRPRPKA